MKTLEITNFRCFDKLTVDFLPGINLIIGDNASGKTSLLKACKYALNTFFAGFSDYYTSWKAPEKEDFHREIVNNKRLPTKPIQLNFDFYEYGFDGVPEGGIAATDTLIVKGEKNKPLLTPLTNIRNYGTWLMETFMEVNAHEGATSQKHALPLIAIFSTHGIHKKTKINNSFFIDYHPTPTFGYYLCSDTDGLLENWVRRVLILKEANPGSTELATVRSALKTMFGTEGCNVFKDFDIRINYKDIFCIMNDGREIPVAQLSDGYKRLFSIVIDIAFRCALLNGELYREKTNRLTKGTVVIDEIDLHLHPTLQQVVLTALSKTFPGLQFIVSTHAPMVMSGVKETSTNSVKYMDYDAEEKTYRISEVETYGMDLSTIAETVLNVKSRDPEVAQQLICLGELIDNEDFEKAKSLLNEMRERFGDRIPELSGFETEIFLNDAIG